MQASPSAFTWVIPLHSTGRAVQHMEMRRKSFEALYVLKGSTRPRISQDQFHGHANKISKPLVPALALSARFLTEL